MRERVRQWWAASWWAATLAPKEHFAATLTPKCHSSAPNLNMLPLLLLLFQEVAASSMCAWSHQPVIWNSKISFGWTSHFRIRQGLFFLSCTVTQHFPDSYLQCPSSQVLRIRAAQSGPACTSCPSLPCHWFWLAQIAGLLYTALPLALVLMEGRVDNGRQVLMTWGGAVPTQKK